MTELPKVYEFDEFRVDTGEKLLTRDGLPVTLTPKAFDTLAFLLENAGRLVEKDALMSAVWPDRFVEESNLTFNIRMIRKALGDDAARPRFIENVPRRGYRFIGVLGVPATVAAEDVDATPVVAVRSVRPPLLARRYAVLIGVTLLCAIAALVFIRWTAETGGSPLLGREFRATRLTDTGKIFHPRISPDGKFVAYVSEAGKRQSVWLRQLSNGVNSQILEPVEDIYYGLAFSPDGENLLFTRRDVGQAAPSLYRISVLGGVATKLAANTQGWISVSPDSRTAAFVRYDEGVTVRNKLMLVNLDGGGERVLNESTPAQVFGTLAFAPAGDKIAIAYGHSMNAAREMSLQEVDTATGQMRPLTETRFFNIKGIVWLPDAGGVLFTANETIGEPARLWHLNARDGAVRQIARDSLTYGGLSIDSSGTQLVAEVIDADFHLYVGDTVKPEGIEPLTQARDGFAFAPDGKIVYASDAGGGEDIWVMDADGANQRQLTGGVSIDAFPLVSPDNKYVYFGSNRTGKSQIWRMDLDGSDQRQISQGDGLNPIFLSSDGKWLSFVNPIRHELFKVTTDGRDEQPDVLPGDTSSFSRSVAAGGAKIAYVREHKETKTFTLSVTGTGGVAKSFVLADPSLSPRRVRWSLDGEAFVYLTTNRDQQSSLWLQRMRDVKPTLLARLSTDEVLGVELNTDATKFGIIRGDWRHDGFLLTGLK